LGGSDNLNGSGGDDTLWGDAGNDSLFGGDGNDILDGGTGADRMLGGTGTGNDTFYVDNVGDQVVEYTNQGTDTVFSSISHTLAANVENLTLTGTAALSGTGNTLANLIIGNGGKNVLSGLAGNDALVGGGSADVLIGATGADRFDFNLVSDSTATARDAIRAGGGAIAFEGAGVAGGDVIDLSGIDANSSVAGNQAFVFGGTGIGRISLVNSGTTTIVNANVDSDAAFEFVLAIEDGGVFASAYKAADFIL
jgi:Ca2+-binding RTX toxin-like protein